MSWRARACRSSAVSGGTEAAHAAHVLTQVVQPWFRHGQLGDAAASELGERVADASIELPGGIADGAVEIESDDRELHFSPSR